MPRTKTASRIDAQPSLNFLVCGTVRNAEKSLSRDVHRIRKSIGRHGVVHFFIVESDSSDGTVRELGELSKTLANFKFRSLGQLENKFPDRIERLAYCRNTYLEHLEAHTGYDFLVVADLDGLNSALSGKSFSAIDWGGTWDAIFANQLGPYYDLLALRHPLWCHVDPFKIKHFWSEIGLSERSSGMAAIVSRMIKIPKTASPIRVESAFGGLGIYRTSSLAKGTRYCAADLNGLPASEHVSLNQSLTRAGGSLYIYPGLINAKYTEHTYKLNPLRTAVRWSLWPAFRVLRRQDSLPLIF